MFKAKLVIIIVTAVFLVTQSNSFSQEKVNGSYENKIILTGNNSGPQTGIFKLYSSRQTQFDNTTVIQFELGEEANVMLTVCDSNGIIVETLINDLMDAGVYNINYKSAEKIIPGELTYKLEVKGISGIKNVFAVK